jgi:hypothetical protein
VAPAKVPLVDFQTSLNRLQAGRGFSMAGAGAATADRVLAPRSVQESRESVLVRFVEPPRKVADTLHRAGVRTSFRGRRDERDGELNHVLLAGSKATQTSADAYIDGDYHGAFSYYFCRTARAAGRHAGYNDVMRGVRETLAEQHFSQVPQLEPETTGGRLFGGAGEAGDSGGVPSQPASPLTGEFGRELLELMQQIKELLSAGPFRQPGAARVSANRALVYVHGICRHDPGYSNPWWEALRQHLPTPLRQQLESNRPEVLWSDLVTPTREARLALDPGQAQREQQMADHFREILEDRMERQALQAVPDQDETTPPVAAPAVAERALLGIPGLDCIDDFVKYLLDERIRRAVQQRFLDVAAPLLRNGVTLDVISHSWGTVVAYESLRLLDSEQLSGRINSLFTVGSALSIGSVRSQLRPGDGRKPRHVDRWVNLDARGDIVGGRLRGHFGVDIEFLNLHPSGCPTFLGQASPACAHSSYFDSGNRAVNRDIFAGQM